MSEYAAMSESAAMSENAAMSRSRRRDQALIAREDDTAAPSARCAVGVVVEFAECDREK
jgi:hypothetical protein